MKLTLAFSAALAATLFIFSRVSELALGIGTEIWVIQNQQRDICVTTFQSQLGDARLLATLTLAPSAWGFRFMPLSRTAASTSDAEAGS